MHEALGSSPRPWVHPQHRKIKKQTNKQQKKSLVSDFRKLSKRKGAGGGRGNEKHLFQNKVH
jgi:hypothetical protein